MFSKPISQLQQIGSHRSETANLPMLAISRARKQAVAIVFVGECRGNAGTYDALWFVQNYVFPPSHAELLSVRGTYKKHDAGDETEPDPKSQSACGSEEDSGQEG
jgi:hypothetical protein